MVGIVMAMAMLIVFIGAVVWLLIQLGIGGLVLIGVVIVFVAIVQYDSRSFEDQKAAFRSYRNVVGHGFAIRHGARWQQRRQKPSAGQPRDGGVN